MERSEMKSSASSWSVRPLATRRATWELAVRGAARGFGYVALMRLGR
jgi:hypothetical protein